MKMNFGCVAAAVVFAVASVSANAATINVSSNPDLLFIAWDGANLSASGGTDTYIRDLGSLSTLASGTQTFSAPTGSKFTTELADSLTADPTGNSIQWGVYAVDITTGKSNIYETSDGSIGTQGTGIVAGKANVVAGGLATIASSFSLGNNEFTGKPSATDITNGSDLNTQLNFGQSVWATGTGTAASQNFYQFATNGTPTQLYLNSLDTAFNSSQAGGYFTLLDAQGDVKWTDNAAVSAVPLPGAAALFLPGLLGMFGLGRRRNAA